MMSSADLYTNSSECHNCKSNRSITNNRINSISCVSGSSSSGGGRGGIVVLEVVVIYILTTLTPLLSLPYIVFPNTCTN